MKLILHSNLLFAFLMLLSCAKEEKVDIQKETQNRVYSEPIIEPKDNKIAVPTVNEEPEINLPDKIILDSSKGQVLKHVKPEKYSCLLGHGLMAFYDDGKVFVSDKFSDHKHKIELDTSKYWNSELQVHTFDGIHLSALSSEGNLKLYSWPDGNVKFSIPDVHFTSKWTFSPDFKYVLLIDSKPELRKRVRLIKKGQKVPIFECEARPHSGLTATFSQDFKSILVCELTVKGEHEIFWTRLKRIDTESGELNYTLNNDPNCATSSIRTLGPKNYLIEEEAKARNLIDIDSGKVIGSINEYLRIVFPKNEEFAIGENISLPRSLVKLDIPTLKELDRIKFPDGKYRRRYSTDHKYYFLHEEEKREFIVVDLSSFTIIGRYSLSNENDFQYLYSKGYIEGKGLVINGYTTDHKQVFYIVDIFKKEIVYKSEKIMTTMGSTTPVTYDEKLNIFQFGTSFFKIQN